tara:strand:+ start:225 stop:545 length:321 start_codon:yes stop_codon:yes gene_type:complete
MKHLAISLAVLMLVWGGDAKAKNFYKSGNMLFAECTSTNPTDNVACMAYISGVVDSSPVICPPVTVVVGQLRDIVTKYLKENPATRHWNATSLVQISLVAVFPCKK